MREWIGARRDLYYTIYTTLPILHYLYYTTYAILFYTIGARRDPIDAESCVKLAVWGGRAGGGEIGLAALWRASLGLATEWLRCVSGRRRGQLR